MVSKSEGMFYMLYDFTVHYLMFKYHLENEDLVIGSVYVNEVKTCLDIYFTW